MRYRVHVKVLDRFLRQQVACLVGQATTRVCRGNLDCERPHIEEHERLSALALPSPEPTKPAKTTKVHWRK